MPVLFTTVYKSHKMELNVNMVGIHGVLKKCAVQVGDFSKIYSAAGHQKIIIHVVSEVAKFLITSNLMDEKIAPVSNGKDIYEIIFYLALNTKFKKDIPNLEQYCHLKNIEPKLSKCLFVHICFGLNLVRAFCYVIEHLPLEATEELLNELVMYLETANATDSLQNTFLVIKAVINKLRLTLLSNKTQDLVDDVATVTNILIINNFTNITSERVKQMNQKKIFQLMGFSLLNLFDLLLYSEPNCASTLQIIKSLVPAASQIMKGIDLNVFSTWAETRYEDERLQDAIAEKAFMVREKYNNIKIASELVSMLGCVARRPKTIAERIMEADIATIIRNVEKEDNHQKLWFQALFKRSLSSEPEAIKCVQKWWHLADEHAVEKMLSSLWPDHKELILKCLKNQSVQALTNIFTSHFHNGTFSLHEETNDELTLVFNQIEGNVMSEERQKELLILCFKNRKAFFQFLYASAFKRSKELIPIFLETKYMAQVQNSGLDALKYMLLDNKPTDQNVSNYVQLFESLINSGCYDWEFLLFTVLIPLMEKYALEETKDLSALNACLHILKHFKHLAVDIQKDIRIFEVLLKLASDHRWSSFLEFDALKQEIVTGCVDCILEKCEKFKSVVGKEESFPNIGETIEDPWSNYYKTYFLSRGDISLTDYLLPNFDIFTYMDGKSEHFAKLLQTLPKCASPEWAIILDELVKKHNFKVVFRALSAVMILLSDFVENQERNGSEEIESLLAPLKYCLQNYGIFLLKGPKSTDDQVDAASYLCRVLKHLPVSIKAIEGLSLINAIQEDALKVLSKDVKFIKEISSIGDKQLCKAFAQKVLASAQR